MHIDLNADLGEGAAYDAEILACVSSANIACGGHAGDKDSMQSAIALCLQHQVAIGAHPSYRDRANFGRTEMQLSSHALLHQLQNQLHDQVHSFKELVQAQGAHLAHLKPHGALYNQAARDPAIADVLIRFIQEFDPTLPLMCLAGSVCAEQARAAGVRVIEEGFADRRYHQNGQLVSRTLDGAVIEDNQIALKQTTQLILEQHMMSIEGTRIPMRVDTVCLHGDGLHALELAQLLRAHLQELKIQICPAEAK
jgi:UPF0271 protein